MTDPYLMTRKQSAGGAAMVIGLGVVLALFEGWVLGTAAREGLAAVFRGRPAYFAVLAAVLLGAGLVGLAVGRTVPAVTSSLEMTSRRSPVAQPLRWHIRSLLPGWDCQSFIRPVGP